MIGHLERLGTWWLREQRLSQGYHLGLGLLLSGLSALAPWFAPAAVHLGVALLVCGSSLVLAGLLDHWQLVRVLGPREESEMNATPFEHIANLGASPPLPAPAVSLRNKSARFGSVR